MHQNLEVDFLGEMANFDSLGRKTIVLTREKSDCGHLVKVILVIFNLGTRLFAHYIYKYKYLYYSGSFDSIRFRF